MARIFSYLVFLLFRGAETIVTFLPLRFCLGLGGTVGWTLYWFMPGYRRLVRRNLTIALGENLGVREIRRIGHLHFSALGRNFMASVKLGLMSQGAIGRRVRIENYDNMQSALDEGKGAIGALGHMGPWELFTQAPDIGEGVIRGTVYQPLSNPFLNKHLTETRGAVGISLFDRRKGFYGPMKHLREGGTLGILVDQNAGEKGVWCPFFGRLASTTNLPAMLSARTGAPIVPIGLYPEGSGRWVIHYGKPIRTVDENGEELSSSRVSAMLNIAIQDIIRRQPEDWFWVHNRWKTLIPQCLLTGYKRGVELGEDLTESELKPFRILVRSPNWLGDACMSVPAVRAIKLGRPDAHVTILCKEGIADLWREVRHVDEVVTISSKTSIFGVRRLIREMDLFDVGVLLTNSLRTALEMKLGGVEPLIGYKGHHRKWLLHSIVAERRLPGPPEHHAWKYMRIAQSMGADPTDPTLYATRSHQPPRAEGRIRIGLAPGAAYGSAKQYPVDQLSRSIEAIDRHFEGKVEWYIFGASKDESFSMELQRECTVSMRSIVGQTSLEGLVAELRQCHLLISNDSGTMHLAGLTGVPTVAIFGSTEPDLTSPLGEGHEILRKHVECSPCFLRECPLDFRCMTSILPSEVALAAIRIAERESELELESAS